MDEERWKIWAEYWGEYSRPIEEKNFRPSNKKQASKFALNNKNMANAYSMLFIKHMLDHRGLSHAVWLLYTQR